MASEEIKYKRLPGTKRGIFHGASLWMGDDHLLAVSGWRFTEDYKRYYYRDIQALVVTRDRRLVVTLPELLAVVAFGITALIAKLTSIEWLAEGCLALLVLLALYLLIVSLTQSCRCRIQTAVSREELPSLYRMWSARKAVGILERRIGEVQGTLAEGWMASLPQNTAPLSAGTADPAMAPAAVEPPAAPPRRRASVWELALYGSLALGGAALLYAPTSALWAVILGVQVVLGAGVLVNGHVHGGPRAATILAMAAMTLAGMVAYADNILSTIHQVEQNPRALNFTVKVEDLGRTPVLNQLYAGGCVLLFAAGGLSVLLRRKE
jgi:fumarate reductase subunit C